MRQPLSIKELLNLLHQHRELIEMLFGKKEAVRKAELTAHFDLDEDKLDKLIQAELIHDNNHLITLDDRIYTFIEEILEIGEVTTAFITENMEGLLENIKYYEIDHNPKFLKNIKKHLHRIRSTTSREVIKLNKNIDDTYKNQSNYQIKLKELDKYKRKRDDILNLISETEFILRDSQPVLQQMGDIELSNQLLELRYNLVRNRDYLHEIQTQIIDYIYKIQYQNAIYKKIQRLKELKDYEELKYQTNFIEVVVGQKAILFQRRNPYKSRLSLDYLYSDHGYTIAHKVAQRLQILRSINRLPAGQINTNVAEGAEKSMQLNIPALVQKFKESKDDLFHFLSTFKFPKELGEIDMMRRMSLYVSISVDFDKELDFTSQMKYTEIKESKKGPVKRIGYALIYAQKELTKKSGKE
ncbi:MAG: hypothetical protein MUF42_00480 [Cytophagaceae bacterium]|jgi:hypothetical protein|nr:hypothetical protein [Cytophagaceae bacterium]